MRIVRRSLLAAPALLLPRRGLAWPVHGGSGGGSPPVTFPLNFMTGSLPTGVSFSGAQNTTKYNSLGKLVANPTNTARFDYDPTALTLKGLLLELGCVNLAWLPSGWAPNFATITGGILDPFGSNTATQIVEDTTAAQSHGHLSPNFSSPVGGQLVEVSFYARNFSGGRYLALHVASDSNYNSAVYLVVDPTAGAITRQPGIYGSGWYSPGTASVQQINISGNVWYRFSFQVGSALTTTPNAAFFLSNSPTAGAPAYTGDGASGVQVFGPMFSYAGTTGAYSQLPSIANAYINTTGGSAAVATTGDQISFNPGGVSSLQFTFDDNSTQVFNSIPPNTYVINPGVLNRPWVKTIAVFTGNLRVTMAGDTRTTINGNTRIVIP